MGQPSGAAGTEARAAAWKGWQRPIRPTRLPPTGRRASRGSARRWPGAPARARTHRGVGGVLGQRCCAASAVDVRVFKKRDFTLLWFSQLISTSGSALTDLAAGILIYRHTGSALAVGLMLMATALPALVVGLIAGVFVDRYDRKKIMIVSCLLRAVLVASIPAIVAININLLYVVVFINAAIAQFFDPAQESVIPDVATDEELAAANSFLSISSFGSTAIGFAAAGLLASLASIEIAFYVDALTFLVSAALILFVTVRPIVSEEATSVRVVIAGLRDGFRYLGSTPILRNSFHQRRAGLLLVRPVNVLLLPFAITVLMATEFEYGLQEGLTSVGFVVGSLFMAKYTDRLREGSGS